MAHSQAINSAIRECNDHSNKTDIRVETKCFNYALMCDTQKFGMYDNSTVCYTVDRKITHNYLDSKNDNYHTLVNYTFCTLYLQKKKITWLYSVLRYTDGYKQTRMSMSRMPQQGVLDLPSKMKLASLYVAKTVNNVISLIQQFCCSVKQTIQHSPTEKNKNIVSFLSVKTFQLGKKALDKINERSPCKLIASFLL